MNTEILILGGNHQNPLGVIEALGRKGLMSNVIIVAQCKKSFVLKSKYVKRGWICKDYDEALICIKRNFTDSTNNKIVAFACCDDAASLFDRNRNELMKHLILPGVVQQGELTRWMDKAFMTEAASKIGFDIPPTWIVNKQCDLSEVEFPCVTKSMTSVNKGKSEFTLCENRTRLVEFLKNKTRSEQIQIQKFIDKEYEFQFLGVSLDAGKVILIPGRTYIEKTINFNNLTFLQYDKIRESDNKEILEKTYRFIKKTGYSGLFSVEFMHEKGGKDYFLEMNFRNDGNGICVTSSGINLPFIFYLHATGGDYEHEIAVSTIRKTYCVPEDSYFMSMLNGDISYRQWLANMKRANCFVTYFKGNSKPFWSLIWMQKRPIMVTTLRRILKILHLK